MESTTLSLSTVTHSSADWWDLLLPLAKTPDRRDRRLSESPPKDTHSLAKRGKRIRARTRLGQSGRQSKPNI